MGGNFYHIGPKNKAECLNIRLYDFRFYDLITM